MKSTAAFKPVALALLAAASLAAVAQILQRPGTASLRPLTSARPTFSARLHVDAVVASTLLTPQSLNHPITIVLSVYDKDGAPYARLDPSKVSLQIVMPDMSIRALKNGAGLNQFKDLGQGVFCFNVSPPKAPGSATAGTWFAGETIVVVEVDDVVSYREGTGGPTRNLLTLGRALAKFTVR